MSMKMNMMHTSKLVLAGVALGMGLMLGSCSSDDEPVLPVDPEVTYKGNVAYSSGILFNEGKELGNGTQQIGRAHV